MQAPGPRLHVVIARRARSSCPDYQAPIFGQHQGRPSQHGHGPAGEPGHLSTQKNHAHASHCMMEVSEA